MDFFCWIVAKSCKNEAMPKFDRINMINKYSPRPASTQSALNSTSPFQSEWKRKNSATLVGCMTHSQMIRGTSTSHKIGSIFAIKLISTAANSFADLEKAGKWHGEKMHNLTKRTFWSGKTPFRMLWKMVNGTVSSEQQNGTNEADENGNSLEI